MLLYDILDFATLTTTFFGVQDVRSNKETTGKHNEWSKTYNRPDNIVINIPFQTDTLSSTYNSTEWQRCRTNSIDKRWNPGLSTISNAKTRRRRFESQ